MKMKVIVKRPDEEYGRIVYIENKLKTLQQIVGGYIEVVPIASEVLAICNEEGKLLNLEPNIKHYDDIIHGTIIICGASGDEFSDIPIDFKKWEQIVNMSGTRVWKEFEQ